MLGRKRADNSDRSWFLTRDAYVDQYRKTAVTTASPLKLVIMLYDGALRFIEQGRVAMEAKNTYQQHESLVKAQRIISELTACLDMKQGGIISENLFALYTFCYNELVEANLADNPEKLATASKVLEDLRSSWISIEAQQRGENKEERLAS